MGHGHDHSGARRPGAGHGHVHGGQAHTRAGERHRHRLTIAFALVVAYFGVEFVGGLTTDSLSLVSDAGHMLTDAIGLGIALAAVRLATRAGTGGQRTYGLYRLEILAALANTVLLFGVAAYVFVEAARRLADPPEVATGTVLVIATVGLVVNLVCFALLREGAAESLNLRAAYTEVLADAVGSAGVLLAAAVQRRTGWPYADPLMAVAIGVWILPRAWALGRQALRVLVQAAPAHLDVGSIRSDLQTIDGVVDIHDLHVWTLTSDMDVVTAHLMIRNDADAHAVLDRARELLDEQHHIAHATLQVEPEDHRGCDALDW